mgnify:CR=1 FL=1
MPAISDEFHEFAATFDAGKRRLVHRVLVADTQTPVSAYLKLAGDKPNCFLLESVEGGEVRGRYSVIGLEPDLIWRCRKGQAEINRTPNIENKFEVDSLPPLESLRSLMRQSEMPDTGDLPPMAAGLFGYMAYDAVRLVEPRVPDGNPNVLDLPDSIFLRPTVMAIFDSLEDSLTLVTPVWPDSAGTSASDAFGNAQARLQAVADDLDRAVPQGSGGVSGLVDEPEAAPESTPPSMTFSLFEAPWVPPSTAWLSRTLITKPTQWPLKAHGVESRMPTSVLRHPR